MCCWLLCIDQCCVVGVGGHNGQNNFMLHNQVECPICVHSPLSCFVAVCPIFVDCDCLYMNWIVEASEYLALAFGTMT
jgi:hypothetical protein